MPKSLLAFACGVHESVVVVLLVLVTVETTVTNEVVALWEVVTVVPGMVIVETVLVTVATFGVEVLVTETMFVDVVVTVLSGWVEVSVA
jgi:hypothetical protein